MHMADALISPVVGGTMIAVSSGTLGYCAKKVKDNIDNKKIPLMAVLGAFVFAAQMINFTIPGTGSSGHLGGGLILAVLLGPYAGFLTISSVLVIQAFFFADGGLLALGCNIFNMGIFPCFIAYPLIYKILKRDNLVSGKSILAVVLASVLSLQLGAFSVVMETLISGITELNFAKFIILMQPIHLGIGIVEGFITYAVITFVWKARPEIFIEETESEKNKLSFGKIITIFIILTALTGGIVSWFASSNPDGLEWSVFHTTGSEELENPEDGIYDTAGNIQDKTALLPDYQFKSIEDTEAQETGSWPDINWGTSVSGILGGVFTFILIIITALIIRLFKKKPVA